MHTHAEALAILDSAECICSEDEVAQAIQRVADDIFSRLHDRFPLVLSVMGGAIVFAGLLLPRLRFPLDLDYIHATRYRNTTHGHDIAWKVLPKGEVQGRVVLVIDDILDEGHTLMAVRDQLLSMGAAEFYSAVLADKLISKPKPIRADFVGLYVPDRYVFGCGMDVHGLWRNLPEIYALKKG